MRVLIECPYCESRLEIDADSAQSNIKCQLCKNEFDAATNQVKKAQPGVTPVARQIPTIDTQPPPVARPVSNSPPVAKVISVSEASQSPPAEPQLETADDTSSFSTGITRSTLARARLKRKRSLAGPIIMGIAVIASAIALIIVLVNLQSDEKQTAQKRVSDVDTSEVDEKGEESSTSDKAANNKSKEGRSPNKSKKTEGDETNIFRDKGVSDDVIEPPVNAPPDKPPKLPAYSFFSLNDVEQFWRTNSNFVVRLRVDLGSTSHYVSGAIVDRRGWVATSLAGVQNAKEIEVQIASEDLRAFGGVRLDAIDSIRGVLAVDPEHDLVLLSINRELVRSLSEVELGSTESLVGGVHLLQCSAPGKQNFAWPKEVRFSRRQKYENLDFDFQAQVDEQKLDRGLDYMIHNGYTDTCVGAPLLDQNGKMFGLNSAINDRSTNVLMIPAEAIKALSATVNGDVTGLSTLAK